MKINKELLKSLHLTDKLTLLDISKKLNCDSRIVSKKFKEYGIEVIDYNKIIIPESELIKLHHIDKLSITKISKIYNCDKGVISRKLKKYGIELKNYQKLKINKELLIDLHHNQCKDLSEIAKILKCSNSSITKYLKKYNIKLKYYNQHDISKDVLIELHHIDKLSLTKISKELSISIDTIKRLMLKYNIDIVNNTSPNITPQELIDLHHIKHLSVNQISKELKCDPLTIRRLLGKYAIEFINHNPDISIDRETLIDLHHIKHLSVNQISKRFKCDTKAIICLLGKYDIEYINHNPDISIDRETLIDLHHTDNLTLTDIAKKYNCNKTTISNKCRKYDVEIKRYFVSSQHKKIKELLDSHNIEYHDNNRTIISPLELDIYIPSKKLAIELNGIYWHSEKYKDTNYHYNKWKSCDNQGIQLIQIWEDDFNANEELILKFIKYKLGLIKERVFARKTKIVNVSNIDAKEFHNINHIQGGCSTSFSYGLKYDNELVAVLSFKNKSIDSAELVRYSTSINVVGGFTKLLSHFEGCNNKFNSLITFADLCISNGNLYNISGFEVDSILKPDYKYLVNGIRKHKFGYRKKKFKNDSNLLFNSNKTERELARLNGLLRVYDAGKIRYIKTL